MMLLPALIFIGVIGWIITTLEPPHRQAKKTYNAAPKIQTENSGDGVTFIPAIYEEPNEIACD